MKRGGVHEEGVGRGQFESDRAGEVLEGQTERDGQYGEAWSGEIDEERRGEREVNAVRVVYI